jgi:hypothetical protein
MQDELVSMQVEVRVDAKEGCRVAGIRPEERSSVSVLFFRSVFSGSGRDVFHVAASLLIWWHLSCHGPIYKSSGVAEQQDLVSWSYDSDAWVCCGFLELFLNRSFLYLDDQHARISDDGQKAISCTRQSVGRGVGILNNNSPLCRDRTVVDDNRVMKSSRTNGHVTMQFARNVRLAGMCRANRLI